MGTVVNCLLGNVRAYKVDKIGGCMILCLRSEVDENYTRLSYYAAYSGSFLRTLRINLSVGNTYRSHPQPLGNTGVSISP